jgi:hypothetical protein
MRVSRTRYAAALLFALLTGAQAWADPAIFSGSFTGRITSGGYTVDGYDVFSGNSVHESYNLTGDQAQVSFNFSGESSSFPGEAAGGDGTIRVNDNGLSGEVSNFPSIGSGTYLNSLPGHGPDTAYVSLSLSDHDTSGSGYVTLTDPTGKYFETGTLSRSASASATIDYSNYDLASSTSVHFWATVQVTPQALPEPPGLMLAGIGLVCGLGCFLAMRRRRLSAAAPASA